MRTLFKLVMACFIATMLLLGSDMPLLGWPDNTPPQDRFVVMCCFLLLVYAVTDRLER